MKKLELTNYDYTGVINLRRNTARSILIKDNKILLIHVKKLNSYITPGGGIEKGETAREAVEREILEEAGIKAKIRDEFLTVNDFFGDNNWTSHYFVADYLSETEDLHLTGLEIETECVAEWIDVDKALEFFADYERFYLKDAKKYALFKREYVALKEYIDLYRK